ncbi:MAG: glycosyltransferase family 2 protein [Candidatus Caenarcaniphilales bacterium]|jgi:glycosyltransferase involved in cell wall biosynthesis|nr:glycosyltransferase family 2 protein [Candidatus Caenarcaniphilales bacterium]
MSQVDVSIFIPVYNEEESLEILQNKIETSMQATNISYEIVYVDDGSKDKSFEILEKIASNKKNVKVIKFRRNFGQTAAMSAGIDAASGRVLIPMDSDLQNDPADIPRLMGKINEGYDVVSGWRKNRKDTFVDRKLPSMIANKLISWLSGVNLHDYGCTLKAYRCEVLKDIRLYGELHRFIPICASWVGAKVTEIPVNHYERQFGSSKYGINRTFKVILDLILIKFLTDYLTKPIYVFGGISALSMILSVLIFAWSIALKVFGSIDFDHTPLPIIGAMFFTVSIQIFMMGILADLLMRTYYESQNKKIYAVEKQININN